MDGKEVGLLEGRGPRHTSKEVGMLQYRWASRVMVGKWCGTRAKALEGALSSGQAAWGGDTIILYEFARIEEAKTSDGH
jgi:hypothetical protein